MMKLRYLAGFGVGLVLGLLLCVAIIVGSAGVLDPYRQESGWTAWLRAGKFQRLARMPLTAAGRLVVVAGSNALFGIDAAELQRLTSTPALNAASHLGLSFRLQEHAPLHLLRRGDIAVLPLEYTLYGRQDTLNSLTLEVAHQEGLGFFRSLPIPLKVEYLRSLPPGFLIEQIRQRFAPPGPLPTHGYWRFGLSETGDLDLARAEPAPENVTNRAASIKRIRASILPEFQTMLCRAIRDLTAEGVRVIGTPDNVYLTHESAIQGRHALMQRASALFRSCGGEWLAVEHEGLQSLDAMYDTEFHLNRRGRAERTAALARALCDEVLSGCALPVAP